MEKYLKDTYGVTVYQEQVMLLSQLLANFTKGEADTLRKAMGKKIFAMLAMLKPKFIERGSKNGHDPKILEKIWADWEKFASYAFNKSHAACYGWVAYQTGYLKANYPAEYMAANLTQSKDSISDVTKFMDECKAMGLKVKGPNVNESMLDFTVNDHGEILFGMGGVKGVGEGPVEAIIAAREEGGPFQSIFDFVERVNLSACNRKAIESLALAGAFDSIGGITREQFFAIANTKGQTGSETLVQYGNMFQNDKNNKENTLFGDMDTTSIAKPALPKITTPWSNLERLNKERDAVGIYLSSHPLDMYLFEMKFVVNTSMTELADITGENLQKYVGRKIICGGIVTGTRNGISKSGNPYMVVTIEDKNGAGEIALFGKDFPNYSSYFTTNAYVAVSMSVEEVYGKPRRSITKVSYLSDLVSHNNCKGIRLSANVDDIGLDFIETLESISTTKRPQYSSISGPNERQIVNLWVTLYGHSVKTPVNLLSQSHYIELGPNIVKFIEERPNITMELVV